MLRRALLVIALGLLGVAAAAALAYATDRLTSQPIGLAEAPASAGDDLVPAALSGRGSAARPVVPRGSGGAAPRGGPVAPPVSPAPGFGPSSGAAPSRTVPGSTAHGDDDHDGKTHGGDGDHDDD
ncbi:MAG: hypothetical protein U0T02_01945 [Solirubrobacteraceae bacterium]